MTFKPSSTRPQWRAWAGTVKERRLSYITDRATTRVWELDLTTAGKVRSLNARPANRKRQRIVRFVGREGMIERFAIIQTIPYCGHEMDCPASQAQYGAVCDFFEEPCETSFQATTLLSARDYAEEISSGFSFTRPRKRLIWLCTSAFILADKELRSFARAWHIGRDRRGSAAHSSSASYRRLYSRVSTFASKVVDDMRGEGAEIFG